MFQLYVRMNRIQSPSFKYVKSSFLARTMTFVYERTSRLSVLFRNHCSILAFVVCCKKVAFELLLWKKKTLLELKYPFLINRFYCIWCLRLLHMPLWLLKRTKVLSGYCKIFIYKTYAYCLSFNNTWDNNDMIWEQTHLVEKSAKVYYWNIHWVYPICFDQ